MISSLLLILIFISCVYENTDTETDIWHYKKTALVESLTFESVLYCCCSVMSDSVTPWTAAHQASLSFTISWSLLKLMSVGSMMPSKHLILCCPLLLPSIFPSIRFFSNELAVLIRWPKCWTSALVSVLLMNIQGSFPLGLTVLISLLSKGLSRVFSSTTVQKHQFFSAQPSLLSNSHICT